jgi:hypothetical protein
MSPVNYQTIRLSKGKHASPEDGACVMELASMLAGESFSDHPASVCPVIGSFLRAYNDSVDNDRRQDLYAYAAKVVGCRGSAAAQRARADRLVAWALQMQGRRWTRSFLPTRLRAIGLEREPRIDVIGIQAVRSVSKPTDETHAAVLALIDELLAIGTHEGTCSQPAASEACAPPRPDGLTQIVSSSHFW